MVLAINDNGALGYKNDLIYRIKGDMQHFRNVTTFNKHGLKNFVVMGRHTYESIGSPLRNRINVILTNNHKYTVNEKDVIVEHSIEKIINHYNTGIQEKHLIFIGGNQIYQQAIPYVEEIYITIVHDKNEVQVDTYFDMSLLDEFVEIDREEHWSDKYNCRYDFVTYKRKEVSV